MTGGMVKAIGAVLGAAAVAGGVLFAGHQVRLQQQILPNVQIAGQPVGGLSPADARQQAQRSRPDVASLRETLTFEGRTWTATAADLGFSYDVDGAVRAAFDVGHQGVVPDLFTQIRLLSGPLEIPLKLGADQTQLRRWLQDIAAQVDRPVRNADLAVTGANVTVVSEQSGREVDQGAMSAALTAAVDGTRSATIPLAVKETPPSRTTSQLEPATGRLRTVLGGGPVRLQFEGQTWEIAPGELAALVTWHVAPPPGTDLTVSVDTAKLRPRVERIAAEVNRSPKDVALRWNGSGVSVATPSQDGRQVDVDATLTALAKVIEQPVRTTPLVVKTVAPKVSGQNVETLGIKELVAEGKSNFSFSPANRITNVKKMAGLLNGVVIAPGEEFSFNAVMGDISPEEGWAEGLVIENGRTVPGLGGGICQVSTTAFRAAFWAGLPITERHDHAYPVPYYTQGGFPEGFDATVWSPDLDFKFKNDTPGYLLMQTAVDLAGSNLTVSLYGTKPPGRSVQMQGPYMSNVKPVPPARHIPDPTKPKGMVEQTDYPHQGMDVLIRRVIKDGSGSSVQEFASHYQPWSAVYVEGTR